MVSKKLDTRIVFLLILVAYIAGAQIAQCHDFDVAKYGAKEGGKSDISEAFTSAWKDACACPSPAKIIIPKGTYFLGEVKFEGPCKSHIDLQIHGTLKAGSKLSESGAEGWVTFNYVKGFSMSGGGIFHGQGKRAWNRNDCNKNNKCKFQPMNLRFNYVEDAMVKDIATLNSKNFHVNVLGCKNLTFQHFTVKAPAESINTDGIHIGRSVGVTIRDTIIGTGDDCISIGDGTQKLTVENVKCGPGHGISVGSLGKYTNELDVSEILVKNCVISNTQNGVRIKTWPSAPGTASATDMRFEDIVMENVENPILIDQEYCPWNLCNKADPSKVKVDKVVFKNIRGTSTTPVAVKLVCSKLNPCNVDLLDIDLKYNGKEAATSHCVNTRPTIKGLFPRGCGRNK